MSPPFLHHRRARHRGHGAVMVALCAAVGLLSGCSLLEETEAAQDADATPTEAATPTPTVEPTPFGVAVQTFELEVGQCFNQYSPSAGAVAPPPAVTATAEPTPTPTPGGVATLVTTVVPCEGNHEGEVYGRPEHPDPAGAVYPGTGTLDTWARETCYASFAAFAGVAYELSVYEIGAFIPTEQQWNDGPYRTVHCFVFTPGGESLGTARGAGR